VSKEENAKLTYPAMVRSEGIPPSQYGTKSLLGEKFADVEEKYDLSKGAEGFGEEGEGMKAARPKKNFNPNNFGRALRKRGFLLCNE
jgi:hypothetical protein